MKLTGDIKGPVLETPCSHKLGEQKNNIRGNTWIINMELENNMTFMGKYNPVHQEKYNLKHRYSPEGKS